MNLFAVLVALGMYPTTMVVTIPTKTMDGYTVCRDFNGNEWAFYSEDADWIEGDVISAIMDSKGTMEIWDDEVVTIRYSGYMEGWEIMMYLEPDK